MAERLEPEPVKSAGLPLFPTLIVALACAAMIALGLWQLQRRDEKVALLGRYAQNRSLSAEVAFPELGPVPDTALFRHSRALCLSVEGWRTIGGRAVSGRSGFRHIAECRTGAEGPGMLVDMGVSSDPKANPDWGGGVVGGIITLEPDQTSLFARMLGKAPPPRAMLIADAPAPGLAASQPPSPDDVPNNHFAYAVQWFLFAGIAALIYALALRRRKPAD